MFPNESNTLLYLVCRCRRVIEQRASRFLAYDNCFYVLKYIYLISIVIMLIPLADLMEVCLSNE